MQPPQEHKHDDDKAHSMPKPTTKPILDNNATSGSEGRSKMKVLLAVLASILCLVETRLVSRDNATMNPTASVQSNDTRYAILDNDWSPTGFIPYLLALGSGMKVLGLASDTGNTWVDQTTLHGVRLLIYTSQIHRQQATHTKT